MSGRDGRSEGMSGRDGRSERTNPTPVGATS